MAAEALCDVWK